MFVLSKYKNKGETIIETVISLTLITLAIFAAVNLILSSLQISGVSQKRIIATNLARECIEAVRSIRDTNWLIFSNEKRKCWNHNRFAGEECTDIINNNETDYPINGLYRVDLLPANPADPIDFNWRLENAPDPTDWGNNQLFLETITDINLNLYTHRTTNLDGDKNQPTNFYRQLSIRYLTDDNDEDTGSPSDNRLEAICTVKFEEEALEYDISLVTHLSDYLDRVGHLE
jgi:type II secretory pathway pseudopilin PulG